MENEISGVIPRVLSIDSVADRIAKNGHGSQMDWRTELLDAAQGGILPVNDESLQGGEVWSVSTVKTVDAQKYLVEHHGTDLLTIKSGMQAHNSAGGWPWGKHHTEMLGHLDAAARRFWVGYDATDPTTANTNATIIEWLKTERKLSEKKAEAIAIMLRPDGLRTGPRNQ